MTDKIKVYGGSFVPPVVPEGIPSVKNGQVKRGEKTRFDGTWTESQFTSRITDALRDISRFSPSKNMAVKRQTRPRGCFECEACQTVYSKKINQENPYEGLTPSERRAKQLEEKKSGVDHRTKSRKRTNNFEVDHIMPVTPLNDEFDNFHARIYRNFVDSDKFQVLCIECHKKKSDLEDFVRREFRKGNIVAEEGYDYFVTFDTLTREPELVKIKIN